jgi:hypothetical protein
MESARELVELAPFLLDIINHIIDIVDYLLELLLVYWRIPVFMVFMIPGYGMMFFLINRLNSIFN